ncbi:MAG: hypothetical protein Q7T05_04990 [Dehalococcoidia bacterium]|nr:hypothetical protein [Dehalococcoidia bacterium]
MSRSTLKEHLRRYRGGGDESRDETAR